MYDYDRTHIAGTWDYIPSDYWILRWSKTHWSLEETVDGSPFPKTIAFGDVRPETVTSKLPQLGHLLSKFDTPIVATPAAIRAEARLVGERPEEIRKALVAGSIRFLERAEHEQRADGQATDADRTRALIGKVVPKLKWTKAR